MDDPSFGNSIDGLNTCVTSGLLPRFSYLDRNIKQGEKALAHARACFKLAILNETEIGYTIFLDAPRPRDRLEIWSSEVSGVSGVGHW